MAEPVRERILKNLVEAIQGASTAFGYALDVKAVDRKRRTKYQAHELPAVNVFELREQKERGPYGYVTCQLPLLLEITVPDLTRQAEADNLAMAAVVKAVLADPTRGGLAIDTWEMNNEPFAGEQNDPTGGMRVGIAIQYRHKEDDPYALI